MGGSPARLEGEEMLVGRALVFAHGELHEVEGGAVREIEEVVVQGAVAQSVVGIKEGDDIAGGMVQPGVAGSAETAVGLMDDGDERLVGCPCIAYVTAAIGGAIIDEDDLEVIDRLSQNAFQTFVKIVANVEHGDDEACFHDFGLLLVIPFPLPYSSAII
jgi:hypothetical protein